MYITVFFFNVQHPLVCIHASKNITTPFQHSSQTLITLQTKRACVCAMKVVCACMCACLAVTVAGKWTEEPEGTLNIDKERQDMTTLFPDNTNEITDSPDVTTNTIEIFTDFATDTSGSNSEITTPADNTPSEDTTTNSPTPITTTLITTTPTTTTTSSTATITTSHST